MNDLTYFALPDPWWPYLFILLAGWLPTDLWRYLGVFSAGRISEHSPQIQFVRAVATALVAAVIARLILYPTGSLAAVPNAVRIGAAAIGFLVYLTFGRSIVLGLLVSQAALLGGVYLAG